MLLPGCPCCAAPTVCWDGINPDTGSDAFYNSAPIASGIEVGPSGFTLTSVTIYNDGLLNPLVAMFGGGYTNAPTCRVFSSTSYPLPNALLATLTPPSTFSAVTWTFTHSGLSLAANTIYWVVMSFTDTAQVGYWKFEDYGPPSSSDIAAGCYFLSANSGNSGATWAGGKVGNHYLMDYS